MLAEQCKVIQERPGHTIAGVVLEQIHPSEKVEIRPDSLPEWLDEYGNLVSPITGKSHRLLGVRFVNDSVIAYAGCYWHGSPWRTWHLYVGVSHSPGLRIERQSDYKPDRFHVESFVNHKPVFLTEHGSWSLDTFNAKEFTSHEDAQRFMERLPIFNRTCYGMDAEILKHAHVQED